MGDDRTDGGRGASILLVEDDELTATLLIEVLGGLGEVHWTTSAEQASMVVAERDWDLVVSDIGLPGMNGLELIRRIRILQPHLATLILSGHSTFEDAVAALRAGADDYLTKPIDAAAVVEKARSMIDVTRERRAHGRETVLAVGAHPDDVEIGIGGILLRHTAQGHDVTILTLTGGEAGGEAAPRAAEAERAPPPLRARPIHNRPADPRGRQGGAPI